MELGYQGSRIITFVVSGSHTWYQAYINIPAYPHIPIKIKTPTIKIQSALKHIPFCALDRLIVYFGTYTLQIKKKKKNEDSKQRIYLLADFNVGNARYLCIMF